LGQTISKIITLDPELHLVERDQPVHHLGVVTEVDDAGPDPLGEAAQVPGVDVMITIFCDFRNFRQKNGGFLKNDQKFA
jgi:hypothetical protein